MKKIEMIRASSIIADQNQPRKNFNPQRLAELIASIKKHGIINPLLVEKFGGKYLLIDGERRFRAAQELKLGEVPAVIESSSSETDRLIKQFHIQEQHEGWTSVEKAVAVGRLSKSLNIRALEVCNLLNLPKRTIESYLSFYRLIAQKKFERNEIPIDFANNIVGLTNTVKRIHLRILEEEFTPAEQEKLENAIIEHIKRGNITQREDFVRLKASFATDPRKIGEFSRNLTKTPHKLYRETNAKAADLARKVSNYLGYMLAYIREGRKLNFEAYFDINPQGRERVSKAIKELSKLEDGLNRLSPTKK